MAPNWSKLDAFRTVIEREFVKQVMSKPERIPAYEETMREMREKLYECGLDPADQEQMYIVAVTILNTCNFMSGMFAKMCGDPHILEHTRDAVVCLGYHVRDIAFASEFPEYDEEAMNGR